MEIVQRSGFLRNGDGDVVCACGCQGVFKRGDGILWCGVNASAATTEVYTENANFTIYRADCLEMVGKVKPYGSFEARQVELLQLSKLNPSELQKIYTWMHDALRCRI